MVGGFVRDYILEKESMDVDICTSAIPKQIKELFKDVRLPFEQYGAVHLNYKKVNFEITTYRMEIEYNNRRSPSKIFYTDKLLIDLKRRDFTMNTLCMDCNGHILDLLKAKEDIENHVIKTVGSAEKKFKEDALRMLRAIRFATELNFKLDDEVKEAILINKNYLKGLSFFRKKQELTKIFSSPNAMIGINLIKEFGLEELLGIKFNEKIVKTLDPIGMWVQANPRSEYQFTNNEKNYMNSILTILKDKSISDLELYKYGNYICYITAQILELDEKSIYDRYDNLIIKKTKDIAINPVEIIDILNIKNKSFIKIIIKDLENKILLKKLQNDKQTITKYLIDTYKNNVL